MENSVKIKVANRKLVENVRLLAQISQKHLPPKMSFALSRNSDHIDSILKTYDKENKKLVDQHVKKDDRDNPLFTDNKLDFQYKNKSGKEMFKKGHDDLMDYENDLEIRKIGFEDLEHLGEMREQHPELGYDTFTPAELRAIDYMIEE